MDLLANLALGFATAVTFTNLAYCFLYFRFYPRVTTPEAPVEQDVPPPQV